MPIRYAFYGDDFTGSTDVLEQLASNGVSSVLFLGSPTAAHLEEFPNVEAVGIAGDSRSRSPDWMSANLPAVFQELAAFAAPVIHYKVCSTFDSSPAQGSIGKAIELGMEVLRPHIVPVVVGAPHLRRYVAFGNLFAAAPGGEILRIDRHPMAHHPVTPMREPDLRLHLRDQTACPVGLVDLTALASVEAATLSLETQRSSGPSIVLFDTIDLSTQQVIGEVIWREAERERVFSASSSGLTAALVAAWRRAGLLPCLPARTQVLGTQPLLVVSGSCSRVTEQQIKWALEHGFYGIPVDPAAASSLVAMEAASASLASGRDTIVYTSLGPSAVAAAGECLGVALGLLVREVIRRTSVSRVLLCGGDTSSFAVQQLDVYALTWIANLQPGAPLCRAHAADGRDLELVLKGGQIGTDDFFRVVRDGS